MLEGLKKKYNRWKNGGYLGGIKTIFENKHLLEGVIREHQGEALSIIEVGSERDVGSTYHLAKFCVDHGLSFVTIDPDENSNKAAAAILDKMGNDQLVAVMQKGEEYLDGYTQKNIVLAYMDGFDVLFPETTFSPARLEAYRKMGIDFLEEGNELSAKVHLETTQHIADCVVDGGIIAFDDTYFAEGEWHGKGATAVPFLLESGYDLISSKERKANHSILLQRR